MRIYTDISQLPVFNNAVVTTGTFDGVHRGHQLIIQQLQQEAAAVKGETVIVSFHPHPRMVLTPVQDPVSLLTTLEEKEALMERYGADHLVIVPFTKAFAQMNAEEYIKDFLVDKFHPHTIITGYDHKFGHHRQGNYQMLEAFAPMYNFTVKEIPARVLEHSSVSSTRIRQSLLQGDCMVAAELLGYNYFFSGTVVQGNQLGRTIGYPTANIAITEPQKLVPANGVYAVEILVNGSLQKGMMNIGVRPTINGTQRVIEVHIFDFDQDIYSAPVTVTLLQRLRNEVKFNGLDELKTQLGLDKEAAIRATN